MKVKTIVLLALFGGASLASAATGFFGNFYFVTTFNGGPNVFNQITSGTTPGVGAASGHSLTPDGVNPQFASFGTVDITDVLSLKGFEYNTFNDNGSNVTHANLNYRIYPTGSPSGAFTNIQTTTPVSNVGNNKTWQVTNGTTNLLTGLTPGNYTLQIYTESFTNGTNTAGNIFGFTSGGNPTASFTVVPETASSLLGLIGSVLLLRRRR